MKNSSEADIIFIRTNRFGDCEDRLATQLEGVFGDGNVVICADDSRGVIDTGNWPRTSMTTERARDILQASPPADWGWRMGDLCHLAVHQDFGPRPRQWLIENDVHIPKGQETEIFSRLAAIDAEFMACALAPKKVKPIAAGVKLILPGAEWGCIFAFNRLDGARIPELQQARRDIMTALPGKKYSVPNDEAILANLAHYNGWKMANLFEHAPDIFARYWFDTNPPMLREHLDKVSSESIKVSHPVLTYDHLIRRLEAAGREGHPQSYKAGRLSRILHVLSEEKRQTVLAFLRGEQPAQG